MDLRRQDSAASVRRRRAPELARAPSSSSYAGNSLRRMATHETGEYAVQDADVVGLDAHDERHEDTPHGRKDEESAIESRDPSPSPTHTRTGQNGTQLENGARSEKEGAPPGSPDSANSDTTHTAAEPPESKKEAFELTDQTNLLPVKQVMLIFAGLNCALFCSLLDQTIVATALPTLGRIFNEASIASWVGTAYMLTSTALQPVYGRLSDIFGRKSVLLGSLVIFLFGSLACALAQTMVQLIVFRAIQGLGGGGILTLAMIIISDVVSLKDRGKYQGITGGVVAVANSVGPILGGIFTEKVTWRWCFWINLPLTGLAIGVVFFFLPLKRVHGSMLAKLKKLDYAGAALTLAWAVLVLIAISWGGTQYAWDSAAVLAPLIIGLVLLIVFIVVEAKLMSLPLIPMYIFKDTTVAASMATTFANGAAFYATLYHLPQYFQVVRQEGPVQSGVDMLPLTFVQVFFSFLSGFLVSKTGDYKWNLLAGFGIWTVGLGCMSAVGPDTAKATLYGFQVLIAVGAGQTFQTSLIAIQASVARRDMATATGCRNFLRMLGGTVALAACGAIVNNVVSAQLRDRGFGQDLIARVLADPTELHLLGLSGPQTDAVRAAYSRGINACFWFCVPMAGLSFFVTVFFIKRVSLKRDDDAQLKEEGKRWVEERKARKRAAKGGRDTPGTGAQTPATRAHSPSEGGPESARSRRLDGDDSSGQGRLGRAESDASHRTVGAVAGAVKAEVKEGAEASATTGAEAAGVKMAR